MFKIDKLWLITFFILFLVMINSVLVTGAGEEVKLDSLLITNGLSKEGVPLEFKKEFSLEKDSAVQYYVNWNSDGKPHKVLIKWIDPQGELINQLELFHFKENTIKSYISLEKKVKKQLIVPNQVGEYLIKLYIDDKLIAVTTFKLNE